MVFRDCCFLCVCLLYPTLIPLRRKSSRNNRWEQRKWQQCHTHTHPPKRLVHPRSPIPPLSTLTSRATHAHPTSPRSTGFCAIWNCISSSSSSQWCSREQQFLCQKVMGGRQQKRWWKTRKTGEWETRARRRRRRRQVERRKMDREQRWTQRRERQREGGHQDQKIGARLREANDSAGNSKEGGHARMQIEVGSECYVGTHRAALVGKD